ncbi:hypothetical protein GH870_10820 [Bacillus thuringiensis]|uniref:hypothetical protein n=1 Tax=Bacillus cereus group TaxID=86661 RepID=UPI00129898EE|nr:MULTISPECIES: hypothetical protein [Bacillus cereus group]MBJ7935653.1 hypothetical protein [Bacillus cereus]MEB9420052.1 hypothetical protein [Bacillus cereus]MRD18418.1 hypothetical protein [Bacillus thuringiensis]
MPYIETINKGGNGNRGVMFSITTNKDIFVTGFSTYFRIRGVAYVDIYVRDGGYAKGAGGWVKIISNVPTNVIDNNKVYTEIPAKLKVKIKSGETKGFALVTPSGSNIAYSDGDTSFSNDDVTLINGAGFSTLSSGFSERRIFNGRVDYELDNDPPTQPGEITGIQETLYLTSESIQLYWGTSTSQIGAPITYDIDIYDGSAWLSLATSVSDISTSIIIPRHINTDNAKIRVQAKDTVGNKSPYKESKDFSVYDKMLLIRDGETVKSYENGNWKSI